MTGLRVWVLVGLVVSCSALVVKQQDLPAYDQKAYDSIYEADAIPPTEESIARLHQWLNLTRELFGEKKYAFSKLGDGASIQRTLLNEINKDFGENPQALFLKSGQQDSCGETGDGHFLKEYFSTECKRMLSLDFYDEQADLKLNLDTLPSVASPAVKSAQGTIDFLVSHQVFEHLQRPTVGLANLNAMLRTGGVLFFSVPFIIVNHPYPEDYFRYTVRNIHHMLTCTGFTIKKLQGHGNMVNSMAYLAGVPDTWMRAKETHDVCDGLDTSTNFCASKPLILITAVATKAKAFSAEESMNCFM